MGVKGAEAINAYMGHSTVQDTTIVSVLGRVIHKQMTIDAEDINGKTRYNSAVFIVPSQENLELVLSPSLFTSMAH